MLENVEEFKTWGPEWRTGDGDRQKQVIEAHSAPAMVRLII
ncbi:hypothetical protein [Desulforamulus aeronauticus]|uniref:Uncharacterized protein n=1 Tax=Desulforamulus aeronauticus DSM 10349 TaxID=1121421 RepID=A0A1M6QC84_9FIRM|nr:hypothetical protein [Desulforamulus aeronauticus]SHK17852.1 hypothetical protein SAMN02745123_00961 [Desulforamulus aeronauticus DSM 10349]